MEPIEAQMKPTYQCQLCKGVYRAGWTEEEAIAEREANFPHNTEGWAVVCDDCYKLLRHYHNDETH